MSDIKYIYICDQPHKHWYEYIYNSHYVNSPHNSKHLFDIYTLSHIFWGALLTLVGRTIFNNSIYVPIGVFILTTYFEIHENIKDQIVKYRRIEIDSNGTSSYRGDALINSIGDIIGNVIGIYLVLSLPFSIIMIILIILFMVITNVVGLSYWTEFFEFLTY